MPINNYLVVGGDSLIGRGLFGSLRSRGDEVTATTCREKTLGGSELYFDLKTTKPEHLPKSVTYAYVVAAVTSYDECERTAEAYNVNVTRTLHLVQSLLARNVFVTLLSSSLVFGGRSLFPDEDAETSPSIAYATQKRDLEEKVADLARRLNAEDNYNVVRLTKVITQNMSPLTGWKTSLMRKEIIEPFSDLIFSPISLSYVISSLLKIGEMRVPGTLHLSGDRDISYADFAVMFAQQNNYDSSLIHPTTSEERNVKLRYKPLYNALAMKRTNLLTGISPQSINESISDITY